MLNAHMEFDILFQLSIHLIAVLLQGSRLRLMVRQAQQIDYRELDESEAAEQAAGE